MIYFISGHRNITEAEFQQHYANEIKHLVYQSISLMDYNLSFVIGDYHGVDAMAQKYLRDFLDSTNMTDRVNVTVYHMFDTPRNNCGFPTKGGFTTDHERDMAMTMDSDEDICYVRPGRFGSGSHQNLVRRHVKNMAKNLRKDEFRKVIDSWTSEWLS